MKKIETLDDAFIRIAELERENEALREELAYYKNRKMSGRRKHNAKWQAIYKDFVEGYEDGMSGDGGYCEKKSCQRKNDIQI